MKSRATDNAVRTHGLFDRFLERTGSYILLTKPGILLVVAAAGLTAMVVEGSLLAHPMRFAGVLLGICLEAGAANALNQFWDRDIDAIMARTRSRRPIPAGKIEPRRALWFGLITGISGVLLLLAAGNALAALLGSGAVVFYVFIYTMWLKRRTSLNTVIGGSAGGVTPLIGWAAGADELNMIPLLMSLVIFLWTPPHFWALALCLKEEYVEAGVPVLPVVSGERKTHVQIAAYSAVLVPATVYLGIRANLGPAFLVGAALLGMNLIRHVILLWHRKDRRSAMDLFRYSIIYLLAILAFVVLAEV